MSPPQDERVEGLAAVRPPPLDDTGTNPGGDEDDSMQGLIRHQIVSILQPFAEHVRGLQQHLQHLQKDFALQDDRVNQNKASLEQHDRDVLAIRAICGQMSARLDKTQIELAKEIEERTKLEADLEATKAALGKSNGSQQDLKSLVAALQQKAEDMDTGLNIMKSNASKMEKSYRGHIKSFTQLRELHDDLTGRHHDASNLLEQTKQAMESNDRELQRFMKNHKKQSEEDTQILASLNAHMNSLHTMMEDTRETLHKTQCNLKSTDGDVSGLRDQMDHVNGQLKLMEEMDRIQQEMNHNLRKTMDNLNKTDGSLDKLRDSFAQEKQNTGQTLQDLKNKAEMHMDNINMLTKTQHRHGDLLKDTVWRTDKLLRDSKRLQEQADTNEAELQNLSASHKAATNKIESQQQEHSKMQYDMQQMSKDIDNNMNQVKGDLGSTSMNLARLNARFEACNNNLQGVGKGLQDVHKHIVSGEQGMLLPKTPRLTTPGSAMLPVIGPRTPRTPATWGASELTSPKANTELA